ncbi:MULTISPECIES: tRNA 5-methoxyuridine(34)/uridine 5-oxyacetic acid(34) synthase CmoB [unclassified Moraxella]|uniref:tRNA 5-methoxyuridine(34)/uridine 5-oxyacetic acid(34) synthase CmoB n=1 Tax=unclassified Moraxella TaxID=2685852 RepID=UPI003AF638D1
MNNTIQKAETETYLTLLQLSQQHPIATEWLKRLPTWLEHIKDKNRYAHAPYYQSLIERLPSVENAKINLNSACINAQFDWTDSDYKQTQALLKKLMPWRKGGFMLGNEESKIHIDTEWRSDWKWDRVLPHISPLKNRRVLDVGGGSGYHGWRMAGEGASTVIVIDPSALFYHQFLAIRHFVGEVDRNEFGRLAVSFIPVPLEALPVAEQHGQLFNTVFSMGVLYHRASPFEHLEQLKAQLVKGGELILETLVVEGDATTVLVPKDRYAMMNNVYCLPSIEALTLWLEKVGFVDVKCVDVDVTSTDEQRATEWMNYQSLADFLDPNDATKTIEGYQRPTRAVMVATKP